MQSFIKREGTDNDIQQLFLPTHDAIGKAIDDEDNTHSHVMGGIERMSTMRPEKHITNVLVRFLRVCLRTAVLGKLTSQFRVGLPFGRCSDCEKARNEQEMSHVDATYIPKDVSVPVTIERGLCRDYTGHTTDWCRLVADWLQTGRFATQRCDRHA